MPRSRSIVSIAGLALSLAGCATQDVVFVTKTSVGIDLDSQSASVAYDRTEGYLAPRYANRQAEPVFASVATDGKLLGRNVKQVYATGQAARIVSGASQPQQPAPAPAQPATQQAIFRNASLETATGAQRRPREAPAAADALAAAKKTMFFGTGSVIGFKLGFGASSAVDTFTFGFKRKEVSIIPHDEQDGELPSVMASLDTSTEAAAGSDSKFTVKQFFATGTAAESLASDGQIRTQFQDEAKTQLAQYRENEHYQRGDALVSLACLSEIDDEQAKQVWQNVKDLELFSKAEIERLLTEPRPSAARTIYTKQIQLTDATSSTMTGLMKAHKFFVCHLPKRT
jgi:hypothetical protein